MTDLERLRRENTSLALQVELLNKVVQDMTRRLDAAIVALRMTPDELKTLQRAMTLSSNSS
jgi:hypothetical protein